MKFTPPRFAIYLTLCDHLETLDQITAATECFHQMNSELGKEVELHAEKSEWVFGECSHITCRFI